MSLAGADTEQAAWNHVRTCAHNKDDETSKTIPFCCRQHKRMLEQMSSMHIYNLSHPSCKLNALGTENVCPYLDYH
jgi:hypothetical protein